MEPGNNANSADRSARDVTFLLVEDDEVDILAMQRTFRKLKYANPLVLARNGLEALDVLRGQNGAERIRRPFIILLDLNMPQMDGIEFLDVLRQDPELNTAVVFVLSTSNDDKDRVAAYSRHVAGYIVKAQPKDSLNRAIEMLDYYWRIVELP